MSSILSSVAKFVTGPTVAPMSSEEAEERVKENANQLEKHIKKGDAKAIKTLLSDLQRSHPNIFEQMAEKRFGDQQATLLHLAAEAGGGDTLDALLGFYPKLVNAKDSLGDAPLAYAARKGNVTAVNVLLRQNAAMNEKNNNGWTALMWAAFSGAVNAVKALLGFASTSNEAIDIDATNNLGRTAFHQAVILGYADVAELLEKAGADPTKKADGGDNALHLVAAHGLLLFNMKDRVARLDVNQPNDSGFTPLMLAMESTTANSERNCNDYAKPQRSNVEELLKLGADPNVIHPTTRSTPLISAITEKKPDMVSALVRSEKIKIDPNVQDGNGKTALMHLVASTDKFENITYDVRELIMRGADCDMKDNGGISVREYYAQNEDALKSINQYIAERVMSTP